jgi:Flp pilus assembly protein TadG
MSEAAPGTVGPTAFRSANRKLNEMFANRRYSRREHPRLGTAAVEFALTAPVLFLLFFAGVEFSRINMIRQCVDTSAYEGARRGTVPGASASDAQAAANAALKTALIQVATVTVTPSTIVDTTTSVTVKVSVSFDQNTWVTPFFCKGRTVSSTVTMARERTQCVSVP